MTIDWVVLTALIIALAALLYFIIQTATLALGGNTNSALSNATISTGTGLAGGGGISAAGTAGGN